MRIKKTLAMLLASTLIVTSMGTMPVNASDTSQNHEETSAAGSTKLSLKIKNPDDNQGNQNKNATGSTTLTLVIKDHEWSTPTYTWNVDNTKCTAKRTCTAHEGEAAETETAAVIKTTKDATCKEAGKITYTAVFQNEAFETQTKTEKIKALGHDYANPIFTWSADNKTATVKLTCKKDASHIVEKDCKVTETPETVTCEKAGKAVFTASVTIDGKTYADKKEAEVPALGHNWSDWKVVKKATATEDGRKVAECRNCHTKKYDVVSATGKTEEDPSNGNLQKDVQVEPDAPIKEVMMTNTKSEIFSAKNIFTGEEKTQIKEGGVDARVWLEIGATDVDSISTDVKNEVVAKAKEITEDKDVKLTYFDVDLFKQITDTDGNIITAKTAISEPGEVINVTFTVPENLRVAESATVRVYKLIRIHTDENGKNSVEVLDGTYNEETGEYAFQTDKFSTYAIVYKDVPLTVSIPQDKVDDKPLTSVGAKKQLTVEITPESAANREIKWTSSKPDVATVDENGMVTAVGNGTAIITATVVDGGATVDFTIKVEIPAGEEPETPVKPVSPTQPEVSSETSGSGDTDTTKTDTQTETKADTSAAPETGDNTTAWPFVMVMVAGLGSIVFGRRKRQSK